VRRLMAALDRYWFAPAPLRDLALVRILAFGTQTLYLMLPPVGALAWVGSIRPLSLQLHQAAFGAMLYRPIPALEVLLLPWGARDGVPPSATLLTATFLVAVVTGVLATIGLFARPAMLCAAAANALLVAHWYSYGEFHHAEALMMIALGVLAIAPSASVWSLDAWRRRGRGAPWPTDARSAFARWPLRLLQWLIALSYLSAAGSKLHYGGLRWLNGYTMTFYYASLAMAKGHAGAFFMASLPPWAHIPLAAFALLFELTFVVAVLVPRTAWLYVLCGACIHLAIFATMGVAFFQTIALYSVFIESLRRFPPGILRSPLRRFPSRRFGRAQLSPATEAPP
jgi:uncharacterized membrane protein YphA (DoxX/SURF4 family)